MNPIQQVIESLRYEPWDDVTKSQAKEMVMALEIPGLVDLLFREEPERNSVRLIPVFATEQDYVWYQLKYNDISL